MSLRSRLIPEFWKHPPSSTPGPKSFINYRRMWWQSVIVMATVCLLPLVITTVINAYQYHFALKNENIAPVERLVSNTARSISFFLEERRNALDYVVRDSSFDELKKNENLLRVRRNLNQGFGGFTDLGVIDSKGVQVAYEGSLDLEGKNYQRQPWFREVVFRGVYISDVFLGFRDYPHFVMAVKHEIENGGYYVLRATIDAKMFNDIARPLNIGPSSDAFVINTNGVFQTPSRFYGKVLEKFWHSIDLENSKPVIIETVGPDKRNLIMVYKTIENSPFVFIFIKKCQGVLEGWFSLRGKLIGFFVFSTFIVIMVILGICTYLVSHVYEADRKKEAVLHEAEYTNKLASLGRLAAGVAHEINNPLAIINEKAGLLEDLIAVRPDSAENEKTTQIARSILSSVDRCSAITHRLLGFARHIDVHTETIYLDMLVKNMLEFLKKESEYREIKVALKAEEGLLAIESDRGQLQQVFLNIINNAFTAVNDGGQISIKIFSMTNERVAVRISDNGCGIPPEHVKLIFEPFFTTKGKSGTGLGLSITYGIVKKLGGAIEVESKEGAGTTFTVILPVKKPV